MDLGLDGLSCFGKLPFHPEFISGGSASLTSTGLDRWLAEGLGAARAAWGADYDRRMSALPVYDFIWPGSIWTGSAGGGGGRNGGAPIIMGRMLPSRDLRGRHHPFLIFSMLRRGTAVGGSLPLEWASLQAHLVRVVENLAGATSVDEMTNIVCRPERIDIEPDAGERYRAFLRDPAGGFWERVEASGGTRYQIMQALLESLEPFRGREIDRIPLGIRFPLGEEDPVRRLFEVSFWIDLVRGRLGRSLERAASFWSPGRNGGASPVHVVFFSTPTSQQFAALVEHDLDIDSISYLERPYGSQPPHERMVPAVHELLSRPESSLSDVLEWAARG